MAPLPRVPTDAAFPCPGQVNLVAAALAQDPDQINSKDVDGRTALMNACSSGSTGVVQVRSRSRVVVSS